VRGQHHAPATFYPRERPGTHCTGCWVGPMASLDRYGKSCPRRDLILRPSTSSLLLYRLSYLAHFYFTLFVIIEQYTRGSSECSFERCVAFIFITLTDQSSFLYIFIRVAEGFVPVMTSLIASGLSVCFILIILPHSVAAMLCGLNL
jgi:hypothetical protein